MPKYRKKPIIIEAVKWLNKMDSVSQQCIPFQQHNNDERSIYANLDGSLTICTLEGEMRAEIGDYIIRGIKGELYPCKPDIFKETYEPVSEATHD